MRVTVTKKRFLNDLRKFSHSCSPTSFNIVCGYDKDDVSALFYCVKQGQINIDFMSRDEGFNEKMFSQASLDLETNTYTFNIQKDVLQVSEIKLIGRAFDAIHEFLRVNESWQF